VWGGDTTHGIETFSAPKIQDRIRYFTKERIQEWQREKKEKGVEHSSTMLRSTRKKMGRVFVNGASVYLILDLYHLHAWEANHRRLFIQGQGKEMIRSKEKQQKAGEKDLKGKA